jgi:iron(III) transport system substrate-binding protein
MKQIRLALLTIGLVLIVRLDVHPQSGDVHEAKKEGKVVVYGSLESEIMEKVKAGFEKKQGIQVDYWRAASNKVLDRVLTEFRAVKPQHDVVLTNRGPMLFMKKEGAFAKNISPQALRFPKEMRDKDEVLSPLYRGALISILYNTTIVRPGEAPKALKDLLDPKWRGKLVMPDPSRHFTTTSWLANLDQIMGTDHRSFLSKLAETKPMLVESFIPSAQAVSTGERPLGISYIKYVHVFGKEGAPLDYVRLDSILGDGHHAALAAKPIHPNAGKLFLDYFISEESLRVLAAEGEFVTLKGIYPPIKDAERLKLVHMEDLSTDEFKKWSAEFKQLFLKR